MKAGYGIVYSSSELINHYDEISKQCKENNITAIIKIDSKEELVMISYEEYQRLISRIKLLEMLTEAEEEVSKGQVGSMNDTFADIRSMLEEL